MSVSYEAFFPYVLPEVPGASEFGAVIAIRASCIEFCEKSFILTRDHDPISVIKNVIDYDFEPPTGYLVIKVMKAWMNNRPIDPLAPDVVKDPAVYNQLFSNYQAQPSTPQYYLQKQERQISLWPMPDQNYTNSLTMRVALKPTRASTTVDDVLFEDYAEAIASGALSRLMMSAGKAYTNPEMAAVHKGLFNQGINMARQRATHGHVRANLQVKLRRI